jgi:hypothetical protein
MLIIDGDGHDIPMDFAEFVEEYLYPLGFSLTKGNDIDSYEKAWLMFVMKEKYNKIWNNGNWENIQS